MPAIRPTLAGDGAYRVALFLFDTPTEDLEVTPAVLRADGSALAATVTLVGRTPADSEGSAKLLFEFKPGQLASGDYKLQFTVKAKDGQPSVVASPFRVQ